jgi:uncharacterized paraquat-inducible protein A
MPCPYERTTPAMCLNCKLPAKTCDGGRKASTKEETAALFAAGMTNPEKYNRSVEYAQRICENCKRPYTPKSYNQKYCCARCENTAYNRRKRAAAKAATLATAH